MILAFSFVGLYNRFFFYRMMLKPYQVVRQKDYLQVFTADLVHINLPHLIINVVSLFFICGNLEQHLRSISAFGSVKFATIYLVSMLTGSLATVLLHKNDAEYSSAGASGSIMGCLFGFMYLEPHTVAIYLPAIGPVTNGYYALIYLAAMFIMKRRMVKTGINFSVHFWGAFGGLVTTMLIT